MILNRTVHGKVGPGYGLATLMSIETQGNNVLHRLSCGHTYLTEYRSSADAKGWAIIGRGYLGKRQQCDQCCEQMR